MKVSKGEMSKGDAGRNNNPPVAIASASTTNVGSNRVVVLDASRSIDPDGESITYKWEQISGFEVKEVKSNPSMSVISFIAPEPIVSNGAKEGETRAVDNTLGFQVTVEDKHGAKTRSRVNVYVSDAAKPIEVDLKGQIKSRPGEPVKLVAEIPYITSSDLKSIEFRQLTGQPLKLEQCEKLAPACQPGPFTAFKMPDCTESRNMNFTFSVAVTDKYDNQYSDIHDLSLECPTQPKFKSN